MIRPAILTIFAFLFAVVAISTLFSSPLSAQTGSDAVPVVQPPPPVPPVESAVPAPPAAAAPEPAPAAPIAQEPASAAPAAAQPAPAPAAPPSETRAASAQTRTMARLSHTEFTTMPLNECANCHRGQGVAPTHGAYQLKEHGAIARRPEKNCVDCHKQQFCLDCHTGGGINADLGLSASRMNYLPNTHRTDFREIHPLKVLDSPQTCSRCHPEQYCTSCHAKFRGEDLMAQSHRRSWSDLQTAPLGPAHSTFTAAQCQTCHPGGLLPKHQWSLDHAQEARRNLQACQTCHSDGAVCQTCHSARQGLRINPHPRNWNAVKDKYRARSGGRSCIVCHDRY